MSLWFAIPLAVGILTVVVAVVKRRASNVVGLHIDR